MKLLLSAITKFVFGIILVGALVFLPAGTFDFMGGWLFMMLLFIPILIVGIFLFIKSPKLLEKRLDGKEKESTQKGVVALSGLMFLSGFTVAGLDFRFGWSSVPRMVTVIASVLFLVSYAIYAEVMRENAYLSRKIEVQEGQTVVSTGLYGIVRHPMYAATVLMFCTFPFILGSFAACPIFFTYPFIIAIRIKDEEKLLNKELAGYTDYKQRVKYRLIPFVW
ncbi:MAG: isoprenylcysteine carboxylmethyltransferase family protein [Acutalibacteraceae bacterium]|nr:isoprenylcysteine carboxylmethyltransferase family protein [Acutalibacteraceae bacterium]